MQTTELNGDINKYLCFKLGAQLLAVPLLEIQEVLAYRAPKKTPNMHHSFLGVLNVRGRLVGIYDCRGSLGKNEDVPHQAALLSCETSQGTLALLVDEVESVVELEHGQIDPKKHSPSGIAPKYVMGTAEIGQKIRTFLNLKDFLSELALIRVTNHKESL